MVRRRARGFTRPITTAVLVVLLYGCSFATDSASISSAVAGNSGFESCGPVWADATDPVSLIQVLSYGWPGVPEVDFVGSTVAWVDVEYTTSTDMTIDTYLLRAVGADSVDDMQSRTFLGGVIEHSEIASVIAEYGTPLPAQYVSEPNEGVVLLAIARFAAPDPGTQESYQPTKILFEIDGREGQVRPPTRVARAEGMSIPRQDPADLTYCE